jgi:hypothetical protein
MFPIAAQFAREATLERARSALPEAPVPRPSDTPGGSAAPRGRRQLAAALRRTADRLEPVAH